MSLNSELRSNGAVVDSFKRAVDACDLDAVPRLVKVVLKSGAWQRRYCSYAPRIEAKFEHFLDFITTAPIEGCGWNKDQVNRLLKKCDDVEALKLWREATTAEKHVHKTDTSNRSIKPLHGTTRAYTLDRLCRERPDLFEQVKAKKLSANAAAKQAGFRKDPTPFQIIKKLLPKLTNDEREQLRSML